MAGGTFLVSRAAFSLPSGHSQQVVWVLGGSLLLALPGAVWGSGIAIAMLVLRAAGVLFLAKALGPATGILTFALIPIVVECFEIFAWPFGIPVAAACVGLAVAALAPHTAWGFTLAAPPAREILFIVLYTGLAGFLAASLRRKREQTEARDAQLRRLEEAVRRLTDANVEYQSYAASVKEESIDQERKRITREIHDIIGYTMTNLLMIIQAALYRDANDQERVHQLLLKAQSHVNESMQDARRALRRLRDESIRRPAGAKLFLRLTRTFQAMTGVIVRIEFANLPDQLPLTTERAIYRLLQESMTNAFRHGKATEVEVQFWSTGRIIKVVVSDNGSSGNIQITEGIGIQGMRERIEQLGGNVTAGPTVTGFAVHADVPWIDAAVGRPRAERSGG